MQRLASFSLYRDRYNAMPAWQRLALFGLVYAIACGLGIHLLRAPGAGISFFWPGTGLAFSAVVLSPRPARPWVLVTQLLANTLANLANQVAWQAAVGFSVVDTFSTALFILMFSPQIKDLPKFDRIHGMLYFFFASAAACLIGGIAGGSLGAALYGTPVDEAILRFSLSGLTSSWMLTPFLVALLNSPLVPDENAPEFTIGNWVMPPKLEAFLIGSLVTAVAVYFFLYLRVIPGQIVHVRSYLLFPLFFWVVSRMRLWEVGFMLNLVGFLALAGVATWRGEFSASDYFMSDNIDTAHYFILALVFTSTMLRISIRRVRLANIHLGNALRSGQITFNTAAVGILHANGAGSMLRINCAALKLLGYGDAQALPAYRDLFFDDAGYHQFVNNFSESHGWVGKQVNLKTADGRLVIADLTAHPSLDADGSTYFEVFINDVTHLHKTLADLKNSDERLRQSLETSGVGIWEYTIGQDQLEINQAARHLFGLPATKLIQRSQLTALIHPEDLEDAKAAGEGLSSGFTDQLDLETRFAIEPQGWRWLHLRGSVVERDPQGMPLRVSGSALDVTNHRIARAALRKENKKLTKQLEENKQLTRRLEEHAHRDLLTGLYNRRFMEDTLRREVIRSRETAKPFSMVMIDIVAMHVVTDTLGMQRTNLILTTMAECLNQGFRYDDFICRLDGDLFAVVLPGCDAQHATRQTAQVMDAFTRQTLGTHGLEMTSTAVVGEHPADGLTAESLLARMEASLQTAKQTKRGQLSRA